VKIELPWPPKQLTPNFKRRHHWSKYVNETRYYRKTCWAIALGHLHAVGMDSLPLVITFHPPDRRRRDDDGCIGAFKAGRDGLADAFLCDDNIFRPTYRFGEPVKGGRVVVEVVAA
jgi:crossover junction endodeoxyribonuclease RusA